MDPESIYVNNSMKVNENVVTGEQVADDEVCDDGKIDKEENCSTFMSDFGFASF